VSSSNCLGEHARSEGVSMSVPPGAGLIWSADVVASEVLRLGLGQTRMDTPGYDGGGQRAEAAPGANNLEGS